jgi:DNA-directed RNA polymerase specialized sigma24 family protein
LGVQSAAHFYALSARTMRRVLIDHALEKLSRHDPETAEIVLLRFFGGLTETEIATVKGLGLRTVEKRWAYARAWLRRELSDPGSAIAG